MPITPSRILTETWAADQIENEPGGALGAAVRAASGGAGTYGPAITLTSLPVLGNNRRRWQQSAYSVSNVLTSRDGLTQWAVVVRDDLDQVICERAIDSPHWVEVVNLRDITGDPFTAQVDDSHNVFCLGEDPDGNVHVWGNMHEHAMRYARTTTPGDLTTLTKFTPWAANADSVTYPMPFNDPSGALCVGWRNGAATAGDWYFSRFVAGVWTPGVRVLNGTATSEGTYPHNVAVRGNKIGLFVMWRGSGDASTNTDFGYIESTDNGTTWHNVTGTNLPLPITHAAAPVIIPAAVGSGLINQGGADFDEDGHPHAAIQMYDSDGKSQLFHVWHDGTTWHTDQVTEWSHRVETVGQTTLLLEVARAQVICAASGRVYMVGRTAHDGFGGAPLMIDVSPGADRTPFKLMSMDLNGWEPAYDYRALHEHNKLTMLVTPIAQVANSTTNWDAQWLGVLTVDLDQIGLIQSGAARIPTIRTIRTFERALQADAVGTTSDAPIDRTVLPTAYIAASEAGKASRLFVKTTAYVTFETGSTSATLYLRESPQAGALPAGDLSHIRMVNSSIVGLFALPWEPLRNSPYVETDGTMRNTWLVPRAIVDNAAGIEIRSYVVEVGILDWI